MHRLASARRCFHSSQIRFAGNTVKRQHQVDKVEKHPKRNEVGVQLLSRKLHEQLFRNVSFPSPDKSYTSIAREHLEMHELDPSQASVLPNTAFTLPSLQGRDLDQHFHCIGTHAAHPWRELATAFAASTLPPPPDHWDTCQSGWTKYYYRSDGSSFSEHVPFPAEDEEALVFDVETMPVYHPYPVLACAASSTAWYAWISPWLLGESNDPQHLVPIGGSRSGGTASRLIVGHNVSYDRARIQEEYSLEQTRTRFLDTMALHVAVSGISSHQRPAWTRHRKSQEGEKEREDEAVEAVVGLINGTKIQQARENDDRRREELRRIRFGMEEILSYLDVDDGGATGEGEAAEKRWEDLTSANSLADVALLHCGITMDKEMRNDFMKCTPSEILDDLTDYLNYCATDVKVTHAVFSHVLPAFVLACPSPVSFAGVLTMGSSFLPINGAWEVYLQEAERVYKDLEARIKTGLKDLAEKAVKLMDKERWRDDVWLSQLDWTPKVAGKSRGIIHPDEVYLRSLSDSYIFTDYFTIQPTFEAQPPTQSLDARSTSQHLPAWYARLLSDPLSKHVIQRTLPLLLHLSFDGHPLIYTPAEKWHFLPPASLSSASSPDIDIGPIIARLPNAGKTKTAHILGQKHGLKYLRNGRMGSSDLDLALAISSYPTTTNHTGKDVNEEDLTKRVLELAKRTYDLTDRSQIKEDSWLSQLDWSIIDASPDAQKSKSKARVKNKPPPVLWPKWYWDLTKPRKDLPPGTLDVTVRNRIAPILLRLSWLGWPLFYSREHGWTFRVPTNVNNHDNNTGNGGNRNNSSKEDPKSSSSRPPLEFHDPADDVLQESCLRDGFAFYKLPHKNGHTANVGTPFGKEFIKYAMDGTLKSPGNEARAALEMNAMCSYWISARDRIVNQLVVWQKNGRELGFPKDEKEKWGIILPQVITMGTVTRRAIEKTWLTASNAKPNRVGSELKTMVRAPPGYVIVGADVDSEELWISSCIGDAQFGMHGASAIGWMTLEGSKAAGSDLHSKTASILGISRDQAKVFNYSRIYGAGMKHAVLLLMQSNAGMMLGEAQNLAENLYSSTKGRNTHRVDIFGRRFWFGGTESYVFNKLEEIASSDHPQTPALGCGVTHALSRENLPAKYGSDYMPSRINWVVQSSGVDYLHLLIVSMEHLLAKYNINARYLISVHDELRYLVKESDQYRAALALQIANLWTRSLFALKLGMDDLPRGVAFFSAVDIDRVLRKEVDMPCVTPSQPVPIPFGERLDIEQVLSKTNGGSLWEDGRPMNEEGWKAVDGGIEGYSPVDYLAHRSPSAAFLRAQATKEFEEVKYLAQQVSGKKYVGGIGGGRKRVRKGTAESKKGKLPPVGNGDGVDWSGAAEDIMNFEARVSYGAYDAFVLSP
jgi:DNA polymerase gamma 1